MPAAYYNEIDPFAAQWLRNLIEAGHIAPGYVDERSISDIKPSDLAGYSQVHFFAGIGVWSLALRRAGWPDDRPVWTGSCPCQPFSSAGAGAGFADERHLWPHFHWLIEQCRPTTVLGEQVASKDAEPWIDLVQNDMEAMDYAFGAIAFPAAGVGAPHIRDRLYWVANSTNTREQRIFRDAGGASTQELRSQQERVKHDCCGTVVGVANNNQHGCAALPLDRCHDEEHHTESCCELCGMADAKCQQRKECMPRPGQSDCAQGSGQTVEPTGLCLSCSRPSATNGFWRDVDWLLCRDGKWRPVEPGTFPLAHGAPARVGRLRACGNAINAQAAQVFIGAAMSCIDT